jgi:hypothetical protein
VPMPPQYVRMIIRPERYRSGHNGADSKSDGRVIPAREFESHPLRQLTVRPRAFWRYFWEWGLKKGRLPPRCSPSLETEYRFEIHFEVAAGTTALLSASIRHRFVGMPPASAALKTSLAASHYGPRGSAITFIADFEPVAFGQEHDADTI